MLRFRRKIYCDNNATTEISKKAQKAMIKVIRGCYANPSSPYKLAHEAASILAEARCRLGQALNVPPENLIFTSCATESNNSLRALVELLPPDKRGLIYNPMEHPAMLNTLFYLERKGEFHLTALKPDRLGRIGADDLRKAMKADTGLVVCMAANNETGTFYDIKTFARIAHEHGALFFCDMVQALGRRPLDLSDWPVDYASFSAHKIHGPKGVGALYVRKGAPFSPFMLGGHQENERRAGTESLHNIAGFAAAVAEIPGLLSSNEDLAHRRDTLADFLQNMVPDSFVNSPKGPEGQSGTLSITFPGRLNSVLMGQLDYYGVSVAAGSACNTGEDAPSHVLKAIGLSAEEARSTLRISLPYWFSDRDLRYLCSVFKDIFTGRSEVITAIKPSQLTPEILFAPDLFIIDLRRTLKSDYLLKPLPGSHRFPFFSIGKHLAAIPRDRPILISCEVGYDAPIIAYYLKRKGYSRLSFLLWGLLGWKMTRPDMYNDFSASDNWSKE